MEPFAVVVVGAIRVLGSLPVLRWPFAGGLLAILVDLADLVLLGLLSPGFLVDEYQAFDKWVDQVSLATFLVVALRWTGAERSVAVGLYAFRLVGFVAFELSGERLLLVAFPNLFEVWFLVVAAAHARGLRPRWRPARVAAVLALGLLVKSVQEWAIHGARLFDGMSALQVIDGAWRAISGG